MICITCSKFTTTEDMSNQSLYIGRCGADDVAVMICPPEDGKKEACEHYVMAPDRLQRIAAYKTWLAAHPPKKYEFTTGVQVGKDERAKPVRRRGKSKKK